MNRIPALPYELWLQIARFIPDSDLPRLMRVHRAFFHLVMQLQYREVLIYHDEEDSTKRCLNAMG